MQWTYYANFIMDYAVLVFFPPTNDFLSFQIANALGLSGVSYDIISTSDLDNRMSQVYSDNFLTILGLYQYVRSTQSLGWSSAICWLCIVISINFNETFSSTSLKSMQITGYSFLQIFCLESAEYIVKFMISTHSQSMKMLGENHKKWFSWPSNSQTVCWMIP